MTGRVLLGGVLLLGFVACAPVTGVAPRDPAPTPGEREPEPPTPPRLPDPGPPLPPPDPGRPPDPLREVRALWVVRTALVHPDSVRAMVARAADAGFNTLLVQVRGRGDAFYRGGPEPRSSLLAGQPADYDPLALVLTEARSRGLEVHAWVNIHLVSSAVNLPREPDHLVNAHPEWLAVPRELARRLHGMDPRDPRYVQTLAAHARDNAHRLEGLYSSPVVPEVAEHVVAIWRNLLDRYDLDGVHLDYIRFAAPDFDYSRGALEAFRRAMAPRVSPGRREELDAQTRRDPLAWVEAHPAEWSEFRRAGVTALMERVAAEARTARPGIRVSAAVFPDRGEARRDRFQDWGRWLGEGMVDAVAPMVYTPDDERFRRQVRDAVGVAGGERVWAGIGIYRTTLAGARAQAAIAREEGAAGWVLFSYDWAVGAEGRRAAGGSWLELFSSFPQAGPATGR